MDWDLLEEGPIETFLTEWVFFSYFLSVLILNSLSEQGRGWQQNVVIKKANSQLSKQVCVFSSKIGISGAFWSLIFSLWEMGLLVVCVCTSVCMCVRACMCECDIHWASWLIPRDMIPPSLTSTGLVQGRRL